MRIVDDIQVGEIRSHGGAPEATVRTAVYVAVYTAVA